MENRSAAIRLLQTGCGAIPPQFSRSKCGGRACLFKFDPAREGSKRQGQNAGLLVLAPIGSLPGVAAENGRSWSKPCR